MSRDIIKQLAKKKWSGKSWFPDALITVGQILVWQKLTDEEWLEESLRFDSNDALFSKGLITEKLTRLQKEAPEHSRDAFKHSETFIHTIPESSLEELISLLSVAWYQKLIEHEQAAPSLLEALTGHEIHPFYLSDNFVELLTGLARLKDEDEVYYPFEASTALILKAQKLSVQGFFETPSDSPLAAICNVLLNSPVELKYNDPLITPQWTEPGTLKLFDSSIVLLPDEQLLDADAVTDLYDRYPESCLNQELLALFHTLSQTRGRTVAVISQTFLQKSTQKEQIFKQKLIQNRHLKTVIALPADLPLPGKSPSALLVFDQQQSFDTVTLIDANHDFFKSRALPPAKGSRLRNISALIEQSESYSNDRFARQISYDDIIANHYNLQVSRYVLPHYQLKLNKLIEKLETSPLADLAELIRGQAIRHQDSMNGESFIEVLPGDINEAGEIEKPEKNIRTADHLKRARQQLLKAGDILLVVKGQVGKVGIVPALCGHNWVASQAFIIVRMKSNTPIQNPVVLFRYLCSPLGKALINRLKTGGKVPLLHTEDIHSLPIPSINDQDQQKALASHNDIKQAYAEIRFLRDKAVNINKKLWSL
ncbi:MAG: N-6 DNA methylase [Endozoicomonas sp.]|uniref:N-6 DNA methylase n=1 Tax=Endozoicomonas sp. TaxID=1892382 RepID=UPI003D9B4752